MAAYTLAQHEYQVLNPSTGVWSASRQDNMSLLGDGRHRISNLNGVIPVNGLRVRVIAISPNPAGAWLYNDVAFTAAAIKRMAIIVGNSNTAGYGLSDYDGTTSPSAYPGLLAQQLSSVYGLVVNEGISGNTTQDIRARVATITSYANYNDYSGVDYYYLGGINNSIHNNDSVATAAADFAPTFAALKAANPGKTRIFQLTLQASIVNDSSVASPAQVTAFTNDLNASIRVNAVNNGATAFIDLARRPEMQNPSGTYFQNEGGKYLHLNPSGHNVVADTIVQYIVNNVQPNGPILSNGGGNTDPRYLAGATAISAVGSKVNNSGTQIVSATPGQGTVFGSTSLTNRKLPAGADGCLLFYLTGPADFNGVVGYVPTNSEVGYSNFVSGIYVGQDSPDVQTGHLNTIKNGAYALGSVPSAAGIHFGLWRRGGVITAEYSTNSGGSWTVIPRTFDNYTGDMFAVLDLASNGVVNFLQGIGLVAA